MCTVALIVSSVHLDWATIPCDQLVSDVLVICQRPHYNSRNNYINSSNGSTINGVHTVYRSYIECPHVWVKINGTCYQAIDVQGEHNLSCSEFQAICQPFSASLSSIASSDKNVNQKLPYFISWMPTTETVIFGRSTLGTTCSAWEVVQSLKPVMAPIDRRNNGSVVCEHKPIIVDSNCSYKYFQCADGTCIISHYECDGVTDCPDGSDEWDCGHVCTFTSAPKMMNLSCYNDCLPSICSCHDLYYQCHVSGGCVPASTLCDGLQNCRDGEDEDFCPFTNISSPSGLPKFHFKCSSGDIIPVSIVNDLIPDCPGVVPDDEELLWSFWLNNHKLSDTNYTRCAPLFTSCIKGFPVRCYPRNKICVFEIDLQTKHLKYCRNGAHLSDCFNHVCPSMYKCKDSYCIPFHYVCNVRVDCPHGEDELGCETLKCPGLLKCRYDDICVHPNYIGNGKVDCAFSADDESLLGIVSCPQRCKCLGYAVMCSFTNWTHIPHLSNETRKLVFIGSTGTLAEDFFLNLPIAILVNLSENGIETLSPQNFGRLPSLIHLSLSVNSIKNLTARQFAGMTRLKVLELQFNPISHVEQKFICWLVSVRVSEHESLASGDN